MKIINKIIDPSDDMYAFLKKANKSEEEYFIFAEYSVIKISSFVEEINPDLLKNSKILDYGCGHGRILRYIPAVFNPSLLVGADVWKEAVEFCEKNFGSKSFVISNNNPISNMGIKFDIIICISVFSHLPPKRFEENLLALKKSLSDKGLLLMTTKGHYFIKQQNLAIKEEGYFYRESSDSGDTTGGRLKKDEYGFMCVKPYYIRHVCKKAGLSVLKHIPQAIGKQDLYIISNY